MNKRECRLSMALLLTYHINIMQSHTPFSRIHTIHGPPLWPFAMRIESPVPPNDENALCGVGIGKSCDVFVGQLVESLPCNLKGGFERGGMWGLSILLFFCGIFSLFSFWVFGVFLLRV